MQKGIIMTGMKNELKWGRVMCKKCNVGMAL
jgi:hypothetical protein